MWGFGLAWYTPMHIYFLGIQIYLFKNYPSFAINNQLKPSKCNMKFLQFYRYLLSLLSAEGVYRAIATFQVLLRQESALLYDLKQRNWDTPALSILNLENIDHNQAYTEIELHCTLMNLMQQVERYHRLGLDAKSSFHAEVSQFATAHHSITQEADRTRIEKILSELYHFGPVTIKHLLQIGNVLEFKKGRKILIGEESKNRVAILLQGAVRGYYKKAKNKEVTIFALTEGAVIADFGRLFSQKDDSRLIFECFEACEVLVLSYEDLAIKQIQYHEVCLDTQKFLEKQLVESLIRIKSLVLNNGRQRAKELNNKRELLQRFNRKDLAYYIALTPEALARISKALKENQNKPEDSNEPDF